MTFVWIDRAGQRHELTEPNLIVAEGEALAREIDRLVGLLDDDDRAARDLARGEIAPRQERLDQLVADLERWNEHANAATRAAALDLAEKIRTLPTLIERVLMVVDLHDEHEMLLKDTAGDPSARAAQLGEPMTARQACAIDQCNARIPPASTATRGQVKAWLDWYPQFRRQRHADTGWFAWADRDGFAHRLVDPLKIETEMAEISGDLAALRLRLVAELDPTKLYALLNKAGSSWERMSILQEELERFEREAEARDRTECKTWAADWRSKRKATS